MTAKSVNWHTFEAGIRIDEATNNRLSGFMELCNDVLHEEYSSLVHRIGAGFGLDISTTFSGGKMIRPAVVFLMNQAMRGDMREGVGFAVTVQMLHNATLAHDDVLDGDDTRRGLPTLWKHIHSIHDAILLGDAGLAMSIQTMAHHGPQVLQIFGDTLFNIVRGASIEMRSIRYDIPWVMDMAYGKTAVLFATAAQFGAISANANTEACELARQYGKHMGLSFQFADDVSDIIASESTNSPIGDMMSRRPSLPIIMLAMESDDARDKVQQFMAGFLAPVDFLEFFLKSDAAVPGALGVIQYHLEQCDRYAASIGATFGDGEYAGMLHALPRWGVLKLLTEKTTKKIETAHGKRNGDDGAIDAEDDSDDPEGPVATVGRYT